MYTQPASVTLLDKQSVSVRLGVAQRTLEAMVSRNEFPPPVRLGKKAYWHTDVIAAWLERAFQAQRDWLP